MIAFQKSLYQSLKCRKVEGIFEHNKNAYIVSASSPGIFGTQ